MSLYNYCKQLNSKEKQPEAAPSPEQEFSMENILDGPVKRPASSKLYHSAEERYADARTTAAAFFAVGGIGLVMMLLTITKVLSLPVHGFAIYSMTFFFLLFLAVGFYYQKKSGRILAEADGEHARIKHITDWFESYGSDDEELRQLMTSASEEKPEVFYLRKYELISRLLRRQFPEENGALLDKLASDFSEEARIDAMLSEEVRLEAAIREKTGK